MPAMARCMSSCEARTVTAQKSSLWPELLERGHHALGELMRSGGGFEAQFRADILHADGRFGHHGKNAADFLFAAAGEKADEMRVARRWPSSSPASESSIGCPTKTVCRPLCS